MDGPSTLPDATGAVHWGGPSVGERARVHWAAPQIMLVHILVGIQGVQCIGRPLIIFLVEGSVLPPSRVLRSGALGSPSSQCIGRPLIFSAGVNTALGPVHWAAPYCA